MKKFILLFLISTNVLAQDVEIPRLIERFFSNPNQRVMIKNDTLKVFWYESATQLNPQEFRDTSIIALNQIAQVKVIKGRNTKGERGIGLQIFPSIVTEDKTNSQEKSIGRDKLSQTNAASLQQKLQGQAAVRIHGIGSINANSPLYVVDGVPLQGNINAINPNDVESVQVLKDPAETAMYGVRGANGVILIKTIQHKESVLQLPPMSILPMTIWCWGENRKAMMTTVKLKGLVDYLVEPKNY
jgi:TonB-dependent SusC/RagA subfamily outer membrane receptor